MRRPVSQPPQAGGPAQPGKPARSTRSTRAAKAAQLAGAATSPRVSREARATNSTGTHKPGTHKSGAHKSGAMKPGATKPGTHKTRGKVRSAASNAAKAGASRAGMWLGGIRISGVTVLITVLVVGGVLILAPQLSTLVEQRQQIADLHAKNDAANAQIAEIDKQRARWDDPAYIRAQARERLYYVMPGEISYLVVNDVNITEITHEQVSTEAQQKNKDWLSGLFGSFMVAGLSDQPAPATPSAN